MAYERVKPTSCKVRCHLTRDAAFSGYMDVSEKPATKSRSAYNEVGFYRIL